MNAHIITIGNELLIGQVIDTNSAWLGEVLTSIGVNVTRIISIEDDQAAIVSQLEKSTEETAVVIVSGGLGPTKDDITKTSIAKFLDVKMAFNQDIYDNIVAYLKKHDRPVPAVIKSHAMFPVGTIFLKNDMGTAPGMVFKKNGAIIISVPGVPYEMKYIMEHEGIPLISAMNTEFEIVQKTILTAGEFEARLSDRLKDIIEAFPPHISIAFLPNLNKIRLRLTAKGTDRDILEREIEHQADKIRSILGHQVFGYGKQTLEQVVGALLLKNELQLSTAESCTGGYIAHLITSVPGSSRYFRGSIVSYSNEMKMEQLGVREETLEKHGAVSEQTVIEMAHGIIRATKTDIGLSVSGIAGPDGGTPEKPVGTIWLACTSGKKTISKKIRLGKDRIKNIESASIHALDLLRLFILEHYDKGQE
jgi:nicotinamide-nucleotide amidase